MRFAADENFNGDILRGVLRRLPSSVEFIALVAGATDETDWNGQVRYLPL